VKKLSFIFPLLALIAGPILAASNETTSPIAVISPYTYWPTNPTKGRFYRPTGMQVGNEFFLYVQGGAYTSTTTGPGSESCPSIGEKALLFKTPWTSTGLRSAYTYVKPVSPCKTDVPNVHYQTGSVFRSSTDGKIKLLIDQSENGSDPLLGHFKKVLLGSSTDGMNFTWSTFLRQSVVNGDTYSIDDVILVQATANSNWWGVFRYAHCTLCDGVESGATGFWNIGRIRVTMDASNPRGFVVYLYASDGTWKAVNDDGSFNFVPGTMWNYFTRSIVLNNGAWEAWVEEPLGGTPTGGCEDGDPQSTSTFAYQTITQTGAPGPLQTVTSSTRAMPTKNGFGRLNPFRIQDMNGKRLLFSGSTDRLCLSGATLQGFKGMEIVLTEVDN
jgi:hypothetical protein